MRLLDELAEQYEVAPEGVAQLAALLELLAGDDTAPTAVRDPARAVETHVADALSGLAVPELEGTRRVADLGAGAGIPGLVLAAARPALRVTEVESAARKCAFLERAIEAMGLQNADVACDRAESWAQGRGACDAVTVRAVAPLPVLVEYAAPLLRAGGALVAWKGVPEPAEVADGDAAADVLGLTSARVHPVPSRRGADHHNLYVYLKVRSLPNGYPRRPGMARKRPLRASTTG
ncbi:MAG: rRNA ((527)-N(7))-methyltransferase RsmG [Solirubrobacteraceae bacterium]|nr:rRNA ((527)-N(7))-methyltransferase RsmG [Solirubrobacteraceae bacterium]